MSTKEWPEYEAYQEKQKTTKLKPAKGKRQINPRCCANCHHFVSMDGFWLCERPNGWQGDTGDGYQWFRVCDGFTHQD